jgi:hypothetical protein
MFDKASIIKAVTQVSLIVIAGVVLYFIIGAIDKKRCNCNTSEIDATPMPQAIGSMPPGYVAGQRPESTK